VAGRIAIDNLSVSLRVSGALVGQRFAYDRKGGPRHLRSDMYKIKEARFLAPEIKLFRMIDPRLARRRRLGQFVIVRIRDHGERIPLTIADSDDETVTLIVQGVGKTTREFNTLVEGDVLQDLVGPLGEASDIRTFGTVVVIGGGVGAAIAYPIAVAMKGAGNRVVSIIGARKRDLLILEELMRKTSDELFVMTDDGSAGEQGVVTTKLNLLIREGRVLDRVLAMGPITMMEAVAQVTRPPGVPTIVSLNPIMVDGTGMCGGCRVPVGGKIKFACVDGPEFDAHLVDFSVLRQRNSMYHKQEEAALRAHKDQIHQSSEPSACRLEVVHPEVAQNAILHPDL